MDNNTEYKTSKIKIISANANSVRTTNKKKKLLEIVSLSQAEIILLQETNLQDSETIELRGFHTAAQQNRPLNKKKSGGGVLILVRNDIKVNKVDLKFPLSEHVQCCSVQVGDVIVSNMYRSPKDRRFDDEDIEIFTHLRKIRKRHVLGGDLNLHIQWKNWTHQAKNSNKILEQMNSEGFIQHIDEATKLRRVGIKGKKKSKTITNGGEDGNIIDVFISRNDGTVLNSRICPELELGRGKELSDHRIIMCDIRAYLQKPKKKTICVEDLKNARFHDFRSGLSDEDLVPKENENISISNDRIVDAIKRQWSSAVDTKTITFRNNKPVYELDEKTLKLKAQVQKLVRRYKKSGCPEEIKSQVRRAQKNLASAISRIVYKNNTKYLEKQCYSSKSIANYLKKFQEKNSEFGPLRQDNDPKGKEINSDVESAEVMVEHFNRIYSARDDFTNDFTTDQNPPKMQDIVFTSGMVIQAIEKLGTTNASSEDKLKSIMLKKCKNEVAEPLAVLFQKVYDGAIYPDSWLKAIIVPIHKGGVVYDSKRYRPVSILPTMLKLYETIIHQACSDWVSNEEVWPKRKNFSAGWSKYQFAYLEKSSVEGNLLSHNLRIAEAAKYGLQLTTIYCDARAAFDVLSFKNIGKALVNLGMPKKLIWGVLFGLSNRSIKVRVGQSVSRPVFPSSGIAQGSSFSGFLFNAAINSVFETAPEVICQKSGLPYVRIFGYADDLKVSYLTHNSEGFEIMKAHQKQLQIWANKNSYQIHPDKLVAIQNGESVINEQIKVGEAVVKVVQNHKDLGVIYSSKPLDFDTAWKTKIASVRSKAIDLRQKIVSRSITVLKRLWDCYLNSILIFAISCIGYPTEEQIKQILKIQRMFFMNAQPCDQRCHKRIIGEKLCRNHTVPDPIDVTIVKRDLINFFKVLKDDIKIVEPYLSENPRINCSDIELSRNTRNAVMTSSSYFKPTISERISERDMNLFRYRTCGDLQRIPQAKRTNVKTFCNYMKDPECHLNRMNLEPVMGGRKKNILVGNFRVMADQGYGWETRKKHRKDLIPSVQGPVRR